MTTERKDEGGEAVVGYVYSVTLPDGTKLKEAALNHSRSAAIPNGTPLYLHPTTPAVEALARAANRHLLASDKLFNAMSGEPTERALESAVDADAALREILAHPEIAALLKEKES